MKPYVNLSGGDSSDAEWGELIVRYGCSHKNEELTMYYLRSSEAS